MSTQQNNIGELIRKTESQYRTGITTISRYVSFSLLDTIEKIDAYSNSKHTSGDTDSMGRDKPFFDIVTSAINIWYRATDIDRSWIKVRPTKLKDTTRAFVATVVLQQWMREENFGAFLNKWGRNQAKNGSTVLKFVEKGGKLHPIVMNWNKIIIDSINFEDNPVIEILELTPAQLKLRKGYDADQVDNLINAVAARETRNGQKKDTKADYIKIYEIHGVLPKSMLTGKESDEEKYVQQMHVVSYVAGKNQGEFDDFTLAQGQEDMSPYMITHLVEEENRSMSIGAVEHLFEAQWMQNHSIKSIKDHLDLASKLIFQTSDPTYVGQNAISAIETGDILVHKDNMPLTQLNNSSHDITQMQNFQTSWKQLGNEINGISEAMLGVAPKSGTAWRQTEASLEESHSLFELMTENRGLSIVEMMTKYVIPHLKGSKINNSDEIIAILDEHDIKQIDSKLIKLETEKKVKREIIDSLVKGELPLTLDVKATEEGIAKELGEMGNTRSFVPSEVSNTEWKDYLDGMEWELDIDVTGEATDSRTAIATLSTVYQTAIANGDVDMARLILNKILTMTGAVSPLELSTTKSPQPQQQELAPPAPAGA